MIEYLLGDINQNGCFFFPISVFRVNIPHIGFQFYIFSCYFLKFVFYVSSFKYSFVLSFHLSSHSKSLLYFEISLCTYICICMCECVYICAGKKEIVGVGFLWYTLFKTRLLRYS